MQLRQSFIKLYCCDKRKKIALNKDFSNKVYMAVHVYMCKNIFFITSSLTNFQSSQNIIYVVHYTAAA